MVEITKVISQYSQHRRVQIFSSQHAKRRRPRKYSTSLPLAVNATNFTLKQLLFILLWAVISRSTLRALLMATHHRLTHALNILDATIRLSRKKSHQKGGVASEKHLNYQEKNFATLFRPEGIRSHCLKKFPKILKSRVRNP